MLTFKNPNVPVLKVKQLLVDLLDVNFRPENVIVTIDRFHYSIVQTV